MYLSEVLQAMTSPLISSLKLAVPASRKLARDDAKLPFTNEIADYAIQLGVTKRLRRFR